MLLLIRGDKFSANFYYYSGADVDDSAYIEQRNKRMLIVSEMNYQQAKSQFHGKIIKCNRPIEEIRKNCKGKKIETEFEGINANTYRELSRVSKLTDISEKLLEKRAMKRKDEVEKIKKAVKATKKILLNLDFSKMKTEEDVKKYLLGETAAEGLHPAFQPIVASDRNSRMPHYSGGKGKLGKLVLVDYGVRYEHYCADLTRTFFLKSAKKEEENYETLQEIFKEVITNIPKVKTGKQLAEFAKSRLEAYGLPKPIHSIGHGIGLDVHEKPWLRLKSTNKIPKSTTMAIEPGAYFKDYGLRFEETVYFDGKNTRVL